MAESIPSILYPKETLLWHGKPNTAVSQLNSVILMAIALGLSTYLFLHFGANPVGTAALTGKTAAYAITVIAFFLSLIGAYYNSKAEFGITNKRVILITGLAGNHYVFIDLEKIKDVTVSAGPIQSLFDSGTLSIDSGKTQIRTRQGRYHNDTFGRRTYFPGGQEVVPLIDSIPDIAHPHEAHRILSEAIEKKRKSQPQAESPSANA